jgi:hypothetical protein
MIQLASDPKASRSWRPLPGDGKETDAARRTRSAHAWPFISQYGAKPAAQPQTRQPAASDHGS